MSKRIDVRIAGQERITSVTIEENTTAASVLEAAGCPAGYELLPGTGEMPFGRDECIYDRVRDGGKVIASLPADVGLD
jgi:hypothetical protein